MSNKLRNLSNSIITISNSARNRYKVYFLPLKLVVFSGRPNYRLDINIFSRYKRQEFNGLDKSVAELTADRSNEQTELSAVMEYFSKITERCIARPESYAERAKRRAAEIEGLKEALRVLEDETAFVQRGRRALRGNFLGVSDQ